MTRKEELQSLSVSDLRNLAKEQKISGRWDMTKDQLVSAVIAATEYKEEVENSNKEINFDDIAKKEIETAQEELIATKVEDEERTVQFDLKDYKKHQQEEQPASIDGKLSYLNTINRGALIAFKTTDGKVKSAMVLERNIAKQKLKIETRSKVQYVISFGDVLWVKTGKRWPRGVYELLKGGKPNEAFEYARK